MNALQPRLPLVGLLFGVLVLLGSAAEAQKLKHKDLPANHPKQDPYTEGDPELMAAVGLVSLGPFPFGVNGTEDVDRVMGFETIRWYETAHFRLGFALDAPYKVRLEEKKKIRAELAELAEHLPEVDPKAKILDPWLRGHLYAQRLEKTWTRFLEIMQVSEEDFPAEGSGPWDMTGKYMGEGPYVGQKGKFEVLVLTSEASSLSFLKHYYGLLIKRTQRWNIIDRDALTITTHTMQGDLKKDEALHGHIIFNLAINLLDGYKHYSYDTPIWIREGLAHFIERELNPAYNTFDSSEGAVAEKTRKSDWTPEVLKLVRKDDAFRMAQLLDMKDYADLTLEHHYVTWSMTKFLIEEHAEGYACLNDRLHGITDENGISDGSGLLDAHREAFRECLGMSYSQFDLAWKAWVLSPPGD